MVFHLSAAKNERLLFPRVRRNQGQGRLIRDLLERKAGLNAGNSRNAGQMLF